MHDYALVPVDDVLVEWADIIIVADEDKYITLMNTYEDIIGDKPVLNFDIPDIYEYKNPDLIKLIEERCAMHGVFDAKP
jgi:predicted protein tyrosine phosphatase